MYNSVKKLIGVCLVLLLLLTVSSCVGLSQGKISLPYNETQLPVESTGTRYRVTSYKNLSFIASSDLISLYFDEKNGAVSVADTVGKTVWHSLPAFETAGTATLEATVYSERGRIKLNSQDNCAAFSAFDFQKTENGVTVTYTMSDNAETAKKNPEQVAPDELYVRVPVVFSLEQGGLSVLISGEQIFVSDGFVLESLSVLPYFGCLSYAQEALDAADKLNAQMFPETLRASAEAQAEEQNNTEKQAEKSDEDAEQASSANTVRVEKTQDFLLVPDGCGGILYTRQADEATQELAFKVYGDKNDNENMSACVGAFGIKKSSTAFQAVITEGDALATVYARRSSADENNVNCVYACFCMTITQVDNSRYYYGNRYTGDICLQYQFLSDEQASYVGMASACREMLIRAGILMQKTVSESGIPLNIGVISSVTGSFGTTVSRFDETEDLLSQLKAKGVNRVNLFLNGCFENGLLQTSASDLSALKKAGGESAFNRLCDYAEKQKFNVYAGINLVTASLLSDKAENPKGGNITKTLDNPLSPYIGRESYTYSCLPAKCVNKNAIKLLRAAEKYNLTGYCINDVCNGIYADNEDASVNLQEETRTVGDCVNSFVGCGSLALQGSDFYAVKQASLLVDVPYETLAPVSDGYEAVPFIQTVLHASVLYSGHGFNTQSSVKLQMLKCVEYGGVPYFVWVFDTNSPLYYGLSVNEAVEYAMQANEQLGDLTDQRITAHSEIEDGVFLTKYENGAQVYVNYNNYSVTVGNFSVYPYDYLRIN